MKDRIHRHVEINGIKISDLVIRKMSTVKSGFSELPLLAGKKFLKHDDYFLKVIFLINYS